MQNRQTNWTQPLVFLALAFFFSRLGEGLQSAVSTNFYVQDLKLGGDQVLWLAGIREIPGLLLIFVAMLLTRLPLARQAALSLVLMGVGYGAYAAVHSYTALIAASLLGSIGFHNWMPLQSSLSMSLVPKSHSGRIMGRMNSIGALAALGGMLLVTLTVKQLGLRAFFVFCGIALVIAAVMVFRIPTSVGQNEGQVRKIVFKRRYWLYYVLIFFEGSRTQVFFAFATWVLAQIYHLDAQKISILLIASGLVNFLGVPRMGALIDKLGERAVLLISYSGLALSFIGYALIHNVWLLCVLYCSINFLVLSRVALDTYANRMSLPGDLVPTLTAGVSVNHITSVSMSLLAGSLLRVVGYEALSWGAAIVILLSLPFAALVRVPAEQK
jgi:predicted MFS family arabinose efflux permease